MTEDDAEPGSVAVDRDVEDESRRRRRRQREARAREERAEAHVEEQVERVAEERLATRLASLTAQWSAMREERRAPRPLRGGRSNLARGEVPWGVDVAAAWSWRFLVIVAAALAILWVMAYFVVITLPIAIALLLAALSSPMVTLLRRAKIPRALAALLVVAGGLAIVTALITFAGQQVARGASDLADSVVEGLGQIRNWLKDGPLNASDTQINALIQTVQDAIRERSVGGDTIGQLSEIGLTIGHIFAGFLIALFALFFFLYDGARIWGWVVRLSPRAARERVDSSGRVAWISLTQFVRATVIVALVDAVGIALGAYFLGVPFVLAIGVLVFLGAFIPLVGATVAGAVAVLVALVDQGPLTAVLMLGVILLVQQLESHILQPFLMGRFVAVHPLGVVVAIAAGILVAGIAGALVAVPLVAAVNAVVRYLAAADAHESDDPLEVLAPDDPDGDDDTGLSAPLADVPAPVVGPAETTADDDARGGADDGHPGRG